MDKLTELCEFLAWVQDNYTEAMGGDIFYKAGQGSLGDTSKYTREQVVTHYLVEKGIKDG